MDRGSAIHYASGRTPAVRHSGAPLWSRRSSPATKTDADGAPTPARRPLRSRVGVGVGVRVGVFAASTRQAPPPATRHVVCKHATSFPGIGAANLHGRPHHQHPHPHQHQHHTSVDFLGSRRPTRAVACEEARVSSDAGSRISTSSGLRKEIPGIVGLEGGGRLEIVALKSSP